MSTTRLTGDEAITTAAREGRTLSKHADPVEGAREGLSVDDARDLARVDPGLVYLDVATTALRAVEVESTTDAALLAATDTVEIGVDAETQGEPIWDAISEALRADATGLSPEARRVLRSVIDAGPDRYTATSRGTADELRAWAEGLDAHDGRDPFAVAEAD